MREGLFWVICHFEVDAIDWSREWELYHLFAKSDSISHKDAWTQFAKYKDRRLVHLPYDYYPRGRVVVHHDKATVFLNQHIATDEIFRQINKVFELTRPRIHAEGNRHYSCYIDRGDL